MKSLLKNPLLYTNVLLLALIVVLAPHAGPNYAKAFSFVKNALAAANAITGEGTINYLANFVGASPSYQIGDSIIYDSGTSIGIDTASPGAKLDVNAGSDNLLRLRQGANPATTFRVGTDGAMVIDNDSVSNVLTLNGGNVGVNTSAPGAKLEVKASNNDWGAGIWLRDDATDNYYNFTYDNRLRIGYNNTGMLVLDTVGNVGIGTANPSEKLTVYSAAAAYPLTLRITNNDGSGSAASHAIVRMDTASNGGDPRLLFDTAAATVWNAGVDNSDADKFKISNNSTGALETGTLLTITASGNIGAGNTSPADAFQVGSGSDTTGKRMRATSDSGDISIFVQGSAEAGAHAGFGRASKIIGQQASYPFVISNNATQPIVFGTNDTERMRITGTGNVGIGIASPQAPLHVNGSMILTPLTSDPANPVDGQIWVRQ